MLPEQPHACILDLGASLGLFTLWGNQFFPAAHIVAVEPDLENAALLHRNIDLNRIVEQVEVVVAAAGVIDGTTRIEGGKAQLSRVLEPGELVADAVETQVIDALPIIARSDFVKIDVEGSEWDILRDCPLAETSTRLALMEWHKRGRDATSSWLLAEELLSTAGFLVRHDPIVSTEFGFLWAWREQDRAASENRL
jgi:FkbM family methyltransferase